MSSIPAAVGIPSSLTIKLPEAALTRIPEDVRNTWLDVGFSGDYQLGLRFRSATPVTSAVQLDRADSTLDAARRSGEQLGLGSRPVPHEILDKAYRTQVDRDQASISSPLAYRVAGVVDQVRGAGLLDPARASAPSADPNAIVIELGASDGDTTYLQFDPARLTEAQQQAIDAVRALVNEARSIDYL